jgi:uncharacterized protein (TIGR03905 family)
MTYEYTPHGVCSRRMILDIEDGIIKDVKVVGGCSGNLQGISRLVKGMKAEEAVGKLKGIRCGFKQTSCPDQLARAIEQALGK